MGKADIYESDYLENEEIFTDLVNGILYQEWNESLKRGEKLSSDEFISGMRKEDKFIPVITIVIYYGKEKPWDGAKTLYELLDMHGNEEKILPFISNYRLNIFDYHAHDDFEQFHSELRFVFEFLRYAGDRKALGERLEENREGYGKLSSEAKVLLTHLANIKSIPGCGGSGIGERRI